MKAENIKNLTAALNNYKKAESEYANEYAKNSNSEECLILFNAMMFNADELASTIEQVLVDEQPE